MEVGDGGRGWWPGGMEAELIGAQWSGVECERVQWGWGLLSGDAGRSQIYKKGNRVGRL